MTQKTNSIGHLPARTAFLAALEEALVRGRDHDTPVAMAVLDIDLFGRINEQFGRELGDTVLCELSSALRDAFGGVALICRYGGDAWSLMWEGTEKEQAFLSLERFRETIAGQSDKVSGEKVPLTISAGLAASPDDGTRPQELINKAHEALYRAKVAGRNRVCLAREENMVTKTSYYTQGQLMGLRRLAERMGIKDAELLREALNDLLLKHNA